MATPFPSRKELEEHQVSRLRELLRTARESNPFYQQKLQALAGEIESVLDFTRRIPFTTKKELVDDQTAFPPFGTNLAFPVERYTRFHQTSGTTSTPLRWLDTPESWQWMIETWKEIYRAAGVEAGDRVYFAFSFGPFIGFWLAFDAAQSLGCLCIPGGGLSSQGRLRAILDNGATIVCCTPSYAMRLAESAEEEGIDLGRSKVRSIIVAGEPGGSIAATRGRLEKLWPGARLFDHHGMTETGPVSHQCPVNPGALHIIERAYLPEVVAGDGSAAGPGECGELVLTTLGRTGSPLLRYRTGDWVRRAARGADEPCACGRFDLTLDGGILGRVDEMTIVRGVNLYPSAVAEVIGGFGEVAEYRVKVDRSKALAEILVQIEPGPDCNDAAELVERVSGRLHGVFNLRVPVEAVSAGSLPRAEMKARRWVESK
jgi:phenylacetate-CoA ligase